MYTQKRLVIGSYKDVCEDFRFKPKTEGFGNCVLKIMELNKQMNNCHLIGESQTMRLSKSEKLGRPLYDTHGCTKNIVPSNAIQK